MSVPLIDAPNDLGYIQPVVHGSDEERYVFNVTFSGPIPNKVAKIELLKKGTAIRINIPPMTGLGNSNASRLLAAAVIPLKYRPLFEASCVCTVLDNGTYSFGQAAVFPNGDIAIYPNAGFGNFSGANNSGNSGLYVPAIFEYLVAG